MFRKSREDANKSQEFMANALSVSKRTVQNWETGIASPNQVKALMWFSVINAQPLPYYLWALYPDKFSDLNDNDVDKILIDIITGLPSDMKKKLLYILSGNHGSSTIGVIELAVAHLHVPLERRINIAQSVSTNFELARYQDLLCCGYDIMPDMVTLNRSIELGKRAVITGKSGYTDL